MLHCQSEKSKSCAVDFVRIGVLTLLFSLLIITIVAKCVRENDDPNSSIRELVDGKTSNKSETLREYVNSRRSVPSLNEQDLLDADSAQVSLADPLAVQAGEAIRSAFNAHRAAVCPSMDLYNTRGDIQYAKKQVESNGTVMYSLEIDFESNRSNVVFARVALLPVSLDLKFQLIFSAPGPCDSGIQEQLAVSARGTRTKALFAMLNRILSAIVLKRTSVLPQSSTRSTHKTCHGPPC
jgi:hypothetical protein